MAWWTPVSASNRCHAHYAAGRWCRAKVRVGTPTAACLLATGVMCWPPVQGKARMGLPTAACLLTTGAMSIIAAGRRCRAKVRKGTPTAVCLLATGAMCTMLLATGAGQSAYGSANSCLFASHRCRVHYCCWPLVQGKARTGTPTAAWRPCARSAGWPGCRRCPSSGRSWRTWATQPAPR